jgi:hypothetical protein
MLGFFSSKEDRVKEACKHLRNWFNPIKIETRKIKSYHSSTLKVTTYSFPVVKCAEIEVNKKVAGFHVYTEDGMIIIKDETSEYKFPPEMLGRVIKGLTNTKIVK